MSELTLETNAWERCHKNASLTTKDAQRRKEKQSGTAKGRKEEAKTQKMTDEVHAEGT